MGENRDSAGKFVKSTFKIKASIPEELIGPFVRKVVFQVLTGVVMKTPVDTGRARGAWQVQTGSPSGAEGSPDKSGGATIALGMGVVNSMGHFQSIHITNNVEYIGFLEEGKPGPGSDQAKNGMARLTLEEVTAQFGGL